MEEVRQQEEAKSANGDQAGEEEDLELISEEAELTKDVNSLLETMNRTSGEVNTYERQLGDAQARHRRLLEQLTRIHEELRAQYGNVLDRARPYFDAAEALSAASHRVQSAVRDFSAAATQHTQAKQELRIVEERLAYGAHKVALDVWQQDGLSKATVRVLRCQSERDSCEQDYARALREFQETQETADKWRAQIGEQAIRKAMPCFRKLQQHQKTLTAEQNQINGLTERLKSAKSAYNGSMSELDRISNAVHEARKRRASVREKQRSSAKEDESRDPETEVPLADDGFVAMDKYEAEALKGSSAEDVFDLESTMTDSLRLASAAEAQRRASATTTLRVSEDSDDGGPFS